MGVDRSPASELDQSRHQSRIDCTRYYQGELHGVGSHTNTSIGWPINRKSFRRGRVNWVELQLTCENFDRTQKVVAVLIAQRAFSQDFRDRQKEGPSP